MGTRNMRYLSLICVTAATLAACCTSTDEVAQPPRVVAAAPAPVVAPAPVIPTVPIPMGTHLVFTAEPLRVRGIALAAEIDSLRHYPGRTPSVGSIAEVWDGH